MSDKRSIHIELDIETAERLNDVFPWGTRTRVFTQIIHIMISLSETQTGKRVLGMLLTGDVELKDVLKHDVQVPTNTPPSAP